MFRREDNRTRFSIEIVKAYFDSKHLGGRHSRRVEKIMAFREETVKYYFL